MSYFYVQLPLMPAFVGIAIYSLAVCLTGISSAIHAYIVELLKFHLLLCGCDSRLQN